MVRVFKFSGNETLIAIFKDLQYLFSSGESLFFCSHFFLAMNLNNKLYKPGSFVSVLMHYNAARADYSAPYYLMILKILPVLISDWRLTTLEPADRIDPLRIFACCP